MARKKVKSPKGGKKKSKLRIPVAKPSRRHKTVKDYDRKGNKILMEALKVISNFKREWGIE